MTSLYGNGRHPIVADCGDAARANVQRKTVPYHTREHSYMAISHVLIILARAFFASVSALVNHRATRYDTAAQDLLIADLFAGP